MNVRNRRPTNASNSDAGTSNVACPRHPVRMYPEEWYKREGKKTHTRLCCCTRATMCSGVGVCELWEEFVWRRCFDDQDYQAPDGGRSLGENFDCATSMLGVGEQGERYALHGSHCDYPRCSINFDLIEKGGTRPGLQVRTSPRVFGSTWTDRKVSRCGSADGGSVKGSDAYGGMPRSEMSRIWVGTQGKQPSPCRA